VGLKSDEGYFVRVARSGRSDFPRAEPAPPARVEWLTVRSASGEGGEPAADSREAPAVISRPGPMGHHEPAGCWAIRRTLGGREGGSGGTHGGRDGEWIVRGERARVAWMEGGEWRRERTIEWEGPIIRTTWEAGPFLYPVELPHYVEERYVGTATVRSVNGG